MDNSYKTVKLGKDLKILRFNIKHRFQGGKCEVNERFNNFFVKTKNRLGGKYQLCCNFHVFMKTDGKNFILNIGGPNSV